MLADFNYETPLLIGCEWPYSEAMEFERVKINISSTKRPATCRLSAQNIPLSPHLFFFHCTTWHVGSDQELNP